MQKLTLNPGQLTLNQLRQIARQPILLTLNSNCEPAIHASHKTVCDILASGKVTYGINTGFGALANTIIPAEQLTELQRRLVLSHAVGIGEYLSDNIVRLILILKINSLARGYSGVQLNLIKFLIKLNNEQAYPCIPCKGSVGASGDLAPLAHLSAALLGEGDMSLQGERMSAKQCLAKIGLEPFVLGPKEGLALLNGTQVSTSLALFGLFAAEDNFAAAMLTGSLTVDAVSGSDAPFTAAIQMIRGHRGQQEVAAIYRQLLEDSEIRQMHLDCKKVQDPYSIRCQPQVMGACLDQLQSVANVLLIEANAVSDNPLVFADTQEILSGGNFHAEPVALAADNCALAIAEIGALAERRIAMLIDSNFSGLPAFLVKEPGLNSGFMIAHVTAAALASENKSIAHPASVDSLPTSANQEDHVSMATFAARRLLDMAANTAGIVAIELLAATQGVELRHPAKTSSKLQKVVAKVRETIAPYLQDRYFAPDIGKATQLIMQGELLDLIDTSFLPSFKERIK